LDTRGNDRGGAEGRLKALVLEEDLVRDLPDLAVREAPGKLELWR
jgi:hypothetical protein